MIHKETKVAIAAGRKYLVYTLTAGVLLIAATAWTYRIAGTLDFRAGGLFGNASFSPSAITVLFLLFLGGVGVKAAIMPLHSWLPAAMVAPTPVSALLHAVAVVKSGVFGVVRIVGFVFGPELMRQFGLNIFLAIVAGATIILASLLAFRQDNLKHRLAYSTVGHLSYIVLGAALLSPASLIGGLLHIANHATMKITLFFCAGAIYVRHHKEKISELDGIGRVMPWTMGAFTVGAIGLAGIPPINGFISKWQLGLGALQADEILPLAVLVLSGLLNAGIFRTHYLPRLSKKSRCSVRTWGGAPRDGHPDCDYGAFFPYCWDLIRICFFTSIVWLLRSAAVYWEEPAHEQIALGSTGRCRGHCSRSRIRDAS